jgi:predicted dehydrogenase
MIGRAEEFKRLTTEGTRMKTITRAPFMLVLALAMLALALTSKAEEQTTKGVSASPLRIGVVGLVHGHVFGFFDYYLHNPAIQIVGITEPNQELATRISNQYGIDRSLFYSSLDDMLAKTHPQAVVTYTSTYDHRMVVEICSRHGVHVMMEKPLAVSFEDALAIAKAAHEGKIQVVVNYETTWYPSNRAAYDLVRDKQIGDIRKIVVHDGHRGPKEIGVGPDFMAWLTDPKLNGAGALFDFGCYGADLATWFMNGQRPLTVTAVTQQIKPDEYPNVDDEATIILTYPKAQAIIQASWNWPIGRKDIEIYGQTGYSITVGRNAVRLRQGENKEEQTIEGKPIAPPQDDPISYLCAVVLDGMQPDGLSSLETNLTVTEILDAARRSAASSTTIRLPEIK